APTADDALLQRGVPQASAPVEGVEGWATLPPVPGRQAEAAGSKPPLPRAPEGRTRTKNRRRQWREGHPYQIFFRAPATVRAAMRSSSAAGGHPLQRFCSPACRHPVERVLERERRWRERRLPEWTTALREKGLAPPAMKKPADIVRTYCAQRPR